MNDGPSPRLSEQAPDSMFSFGMGGTTGSNSDAAGGSQRRKERSSSVPDFQHFGTSSGGGYTSTGSVASSTSSAATGGGTSSVRASSGSTQQQQQQRDGTRRTQSFTQYSDRLQTNMESKALQRSANIVSPSGFTPDQTASVQSSLVSASSLALPARLRMIELFHFWTATSGAGDAVDAMIAATMKEAGLDKRATPERSTAAAAAAAAAAASCQEDEDAWKATSVDSPTDTEKHLPLATGAQDLDSSVFSSAGGVGGRGATGIDLPSGSMTMRSFSDSVQNVSPQDASGGSGGGGVAAGGGVNPLISITELSREHVGPAIQIDDLPLSEASSQNDIGTTGGGGGAGAAGTSVEGNPLMASAPGQEKPNDQSPRRLTAKQPRTSFSPHRSPRSTFLSPMQNAHSHIVDELDAAHARGGLSPRASAGSMLSGPDATFHPPSPLDSSFSAADNHAAGHGMKNLNIDGMLATTPRSQRDDASHSARTSRSPSPQALRGGTDAGELSRTNSLMSLDLPRPNSSGRRVAAATSSKSENKMAETSMSLSAPPKPVYATYQDIPRFYFSEGKPQTQSATLVGPHSTRHENPHLTIFEGVNVPLGQHQGIIEPPTGPKMAPMLALAVMEDEDVLPFIQRELGRLPQAPSATPNVGTVGIAGSRSKTKVAGLRRPSTSQSSASKQDAQYRQVVTQTMQRICTQAFGLPKYFTPLVMRKVASDEAAAASSANANDSSTSEQFPDGQPGSVGGTTPTGSSGGSQRATTSHGSNKPGAGGAGGSGANQLPVLTVSNVHAFYEKYLRFKSIVRRMFEVLTCNKKPCASSAGGSSANATSGSAGSASAAAGASSSVVSAVVGTSVKSRAGMAKGGSQAPVPPSNSTTSAGGATSGCDQQSPSGRGSRGGFVTREELQSYVEVLLETHPGLGFLRSTADFQQKYLETVIIRIFYDVDRLDRNRISWPEFERSKLPDAIRQVDATDDINTVLTYFSYEHFYVLYCRFWELDEDRDLLLSPTDLSRYAPEGMNPKIVERIFQGIGRKLTCKSRGKMNFEDFLWFCLSEEDKSSQRAIRYWFRVLDLDGDGVISGHELETFYSFTKQKLQMLMSEGIDFGDVMCQISDMTGFSCHQGLHLTDLLKSPNSAFVALNMVLNVVKFVQFEQRDPFVAHHDRLTGGFERCEWDRFARMEYDRMAAEAD